MEATEITTEELVKFAAEKLGGELQKPWQISSTGYGWRIRAKRDGSRTIMEGQGDFISSWDLLGKGMAVAIKAGIEPHIYHDEVRLWITEDQRNQIGRLVLVPCKDVMEAPLAFWKAWYQLEHP